MAQSKGPEAFVGSWMGDLKAGGATLRLVFNVAAAGGGLSATMDSPDQGAKGIPVSSATAQGDSIRLEVKLAQGLYIGTISSDGASIEGSWSQSGASFPILLKKLPAPFAFERPQEPKPPFPYTSIEVMITNAKPGVVLAGTLTIPRGNGPFPAVVLVTGSGAQNRDEEILGHKPFLVIADYLARNGIAALRCDDRGVGGSKGNLATATTLDFADDAEAAFSFLRARSEVDPKRVGIVGHSEGGLIAPIVAARNPAVAFIVLLAGPGLRGDQLVPAQGRAINRAAGLDEATTKWSEDLNRRLYAIAEKPGDAAALLPEARAAYLEGIDASPALTPEQKAQGKADVDKVVAPLLSPWYRTFLALDPATYLSKVRIPVLALNGTNDLQVPADLDLPAIEAALKAAGNTSYKLVRLEGLNHLFQHAPTGLPAEYESITETFAPEALSMIRDWILAR